MYKVGIIGVGKMGSCILNGIVNNSIYNKEELILSANSKNILYKEDGYSTTTDLEYVFNNSNIVFLCVKPQKFNELFKDLKYKNDKLLVVSVAAGVTIKELNTLFNTNNIIRVMPNTPLSINMGMVSLSRTNDVLDSDLKLIKNIFDKMGETVIIHEDMINAFIPLCGSMPAYLFQFMKLFVKCGIEYGFTEEEARKICINAVIGSANLANQSTKSFDELISDVSSKGGTTIAGTNALLENGFDESIRACFKACFDRAIELENNK